jgi:hypothetical protein
MRDAGSACGVKPASNVALLAVMFRAGLVSISLWVWKSAPEGTQLTEPIRLQLLPPNAFVTVPSSKLRDSIRLESTSGTPVDGFAMVV